MTSVSARLSQWAAEHLKYWEQAAFDKLVRGAAFTDSDYEELLRYLLEDAGLAESEGVRPTLRLPKDADAGSQPATQPRLLSISNLQNVNALVPNQTLTFGPGMTAIFGGNGSGKSGYARVLGCAGFTRGDQVVLPDVTRPVDETTVLSADVEVQEGGTARVIQYEIGRECPELASCYVFDSTSVHIHLTASNELSFSPAGLSYLTRLAEVTDEVRSRLKARVDKYSQPHQFNALFQGDSAVASLIAALGPTTDTNQLGKMAELSTEERERIDELDLEVARLKTQDISKEKGRAEQSLEDLEELVGHLRQAQECLGKEGLQELRTAVETCLARRKAAQQISVQQFESQYFTQTGSDIWYRFVEAARSLADAEEAPGVPYPQPDSRCLLCGQPLSDEARGLLSRLWTFLEGAAQTKLEEAEAALVRKEDVLRDLSLDFFDDDSVSYRYLHEHAPSVSDKVKRFVKACRERRKPALGALASGGWELSFGSLPNNGTSQVDEIVAQLRAQVVELAEKDTAQEIARLEQEKRNLQHRAVLGEHLDEIRAYVEKRIWAQRAEKAGGSTRRITTKHNQLFNELVTQRYIELFEKLLQDLGRPLSVDVKTKGRKGATYKQIAVRADPSAPEEMTVPDKVLSEGEKRAVALADFLTEVALDTTSSAIILDDPVTSLDLEWAQLIASILAEEAKRRQVIVFTHDLPFLYHLKKHCEQSQAGLVTHWIKRGAYDGKPGYVFLNNSPALEREYRKATRARNIYARAKDATAADQEALLREGFGALRSCYEAFIIFDLFNEVVMRFDERVSFGRLDQIVWDKSIVAEVTEKCELLSRYIEGHLHSNAFGAHKPAPSTLLTEIEAFDALQKRLRNLRKSSA